ncbi:MAG: glycoside hydrolase family 13 protein [Chloroflexota bacterium]|nr:glycoside hydrolase family 13 protein [Chloroflexota bacterium]MDQ5864622.1 glycoside hydrolase family 13 protein [Chloroflexota bacterium]
MPDDNLSVQAAKRLRGGNMPHVPPPSSPTSTRVSLALQAPPDAYPEVLFTDPRREHGWRVALAWNDASNVWQTVVLLPHEPTVLTYHFVLRDGSTIRERHQVEGETEMLYGVWEEREFQIAVYDPNDTPPSWLPGTIFYQIFPDRFAQSDPDNVRKGGDTYGQEPLYLGWEDKPEHPPKGRDFFGGDLPGVMSKLDYLKELGVTCIYFTPIFASPTNHRYDATDYSRIDPRLGTEDDLKQLIAEARDRGIRVLLDGVFNHCSSDSIYFQDALKSKESPYFRWFDFLHWPERWVGWLGIRHKLTTWGIKTMPEFVECPEVEEFFFGKDGIALKWLSLGTVGWRTDVTPWVTHEFWRRFRKAVRRAYPEAYLVAEDWENAPQRLVGDSFDATMNYRFGYSVLGFASGKLTPTQLDDRLETRRRDTPPLALHAQMNILGSHDTARILTRMEGNKERVMLATALQLAYPGSPMIYYGDEAGVEGSYAEEGRAPYPWGREDPQLLDFFRTAMNARLDSAALGKGDVSTVWIDDRGGYGILRTHGSDRVVALFNNSDAPLEAEVLLGNGVQDREVSDLLARLPAASLSGGTLRVTVPPLGAGWYRLS